MMIIITSIHSGTIALTSNSVIIQLSIGLTLGLGLGTEIDSGQT